MERLIRNVERNAWQEFKQEANMHNMQLAAFLAYLVKEHKRMESNKSKSWDYVLKGKKSLTAKDASAIRESLGIFEKEYGFEVRY